MGRDKRIKEIEKYMRRTLQHLGHHCCSINSEEYNRIVELLYEIEEDLKWQKKNLKHWRR